MTSAGSPEMIREGILLWNKERERLLKKFVRGEKGGDGLPEGTGSFGEKI